MVVPAPPALPKLLPLLWVLMLLGWPLTTSTIADTVSTPTPLFRTPEKHPPERPPTRSFQPLSPADEAWLLRCVLDPTAENCHPNVAANSRAQQPSTPSAFRPSDLDGRSTTQGTPNEWPQWIARVGGIPAYGMQRVRKASDTLARMIGIPVTKTPVAPKRRAPSTPKLYDRIIVGGGAAGCPLARTLADGGLDVLVIERGGSRKENPDTLDAYGAGIVVDNPKVSQLVVTNEGIRSHVANVLSGGTAINMAILISEVAQFFDYLEATYKGVHFTRPLLYQALNWTVSHLAHKMPNVPATDPNVTKYIQKWATQQLGPNLGYQSAVAVNHTWESYSQFNARNEWYRLTSDNLLGTPKEFPKTLHILLHHVVHKVEMTRDPVTHRLRASCVILQREVEEDMAPLYTGTAFRDRYRLVAVSTGSNEISQEYLKNGRLRFLAKIPPGQKFRACVKPDGGEIILSAGAIMTPVVLFKSGIGPKDVIERAGVPLVYEIPQLGRNLKDRVFIPLGFFLKEPLPIVGFPPRISHTMGLATLGPDCSRFRIGAQSETCTTVSIEQLSGARIVEGVVYASRFLIPPRFRNHLLMDMVVQILKGCSQGGSIASDALCSITLPIAVCFRKCIATFYFTAEPKSRGSVDIDAFGGVEVNANYLSHPQDIQAVIRGTATALKITSSPDASTVLETVSSRSCPTVILQSMLKILDAVIDVMSRRHTEDALPYKNVSANALAQLHQTALWIHQYFKDQMSYLDQRIEDVQGLNAQLRTTGDAVASEFHTGETDSRTKFLQFLETTDKTKTQENMDFDTIRPLVDTDSAFGHQKFASFPPLLPNPDNETDVLRYAKDSMTSIWHWVGSAAMGIVVDHKFRVKGVDKLRIVDASVLTQVTRMNPTATIVALGRYAGFVLLDELQHGKNHT